MLPLSLIHILDFPAAHKLCTKCNTFRGIMISTDCKHLFPAISKSREKLIKQLYRLRRRNRLIIDIPRDHNRIHLFFQCDLFDLP